MKFKDLMGSNNKSVLKEVSNVSIKDTIVGINSEFVGNITFSKILKISGTVKGNITSTEDDDARIIIDEKGLVEGDVTAPVIILQGEVNGNVHSSTKMEIDATALITGNVYYDILEMHGGSTVNGSLIRNKGKTAGLLEKKEGDNVEKKKEGVNVEKKEGTNVEKKKEGVNGDKKTGFLQSIVPNKNSADKKDS
jgi:cytoskeletal protein CcmA (bactofilin family)